MILILLQFTVLAGVIAFAGSRLSRYGDAIAEKTGLGRTWIGVVLLATVTSVPELATGVTAVTIANAPELAVGDVLGSCMFNLLIIAILDVVGGGAPISTKAHNGQVVAAGFSILLLSFVALSLLGHSAYPGMFGFGLTAPLILVIYVLAMRTIHRYEQERAVSTDQQPSAGYEGMTLRVAVRNYVFFGMVIIAAASFLLHVAARIAVMTGLGETFVGNLFVATATSLPELAVSIAALRMGAVDLALGNLFGSNLFNMAVLAIDDLLYTRAPILEAVSPSHGVAALIAIAMSAVAIVAIIIRAGRRFLFVTWESAVLLSLYILGALLLYVMRVPVEVLA
jgi:cation:H+ antiporter